MEVLMATFMFKSFYNNNVGKLSYGPQEFRGPFFYAPINIRRYKLIN